MSSDPVFSDVFTDASFPLCATVSIFRLLSGDDQWHSCYCHPNLHFTSSRYWLKRYFWISPLFKLQTNHKHSSFLELQTNHIYISHSLSGNLSLICMCLNSLLLLMPLIKEVIYFSACLTSQHTRTLKYLSVGHSGALRSSRHPGLGCPKSWVSKGQVSNSLAGL